MRHDGRRVLILGATGTGKSLLLKVLRDQPPRGCTATVLLDTDGEHARPLKRNLQVVARYVPPARPEPREGDPPDLPLFGWSEEICGAVFERGRTWLVWDEVQEACSVHKIGPNFRAIVRRGRKRGISWAVATQRPSQIHHIIQASASDLCVFRQVDLPDLEVCRRMGADPELVRSLPIKSFLHRRAGDASFHQHHTVVGDWCSQPTRVTTENADA